MRRLINHKIKKGSIFEILNNPTHIMDRDYFLFIFITDEFDVKIKKDILDFVCDNQDAYGNYMLMRDHLDTSVTNILDCEPCLIEINANGIKKFKSAKSEDRFWKDIERLVTVRRAKQKAIIIESISKDISPKVRQNADSIFVPQEMEVGDGWDESRIIRY